MPANINLSTAHWLKSSFSQQGGDCIEVAPGFTGVMPVRDSKDPNGPALLFSPTAWQSFITAVNAGEFDAR
ncbi:DUF397 domain-containing protein [Streptomyces sp. SP17BM10]|uniref:DUF397 domain-containing protein n=1 Tax=Streptomyces sp. SP17BM10 TaxID=3002530 RepID=UPI002E788072|nr:DUF397 domain-containing protein [Streptomyces sp. SP17BM10]MEE1784142.1 DUF397 domain-containing protein [Streptomyces sp. SP17BM10]